MILAHYDETGVPSFYDTELSYPEGIPTPNIVITEEQRRDFFARGQRHRVIDGVWTYVEPPAPTQEEIQKQKLAALDAEYQPQFDELAQAWAAASMDGNTTLANSITADRTALKVEYAEKKKVIENG